HGISNQIDGHIKIKPFWWRIIVGKRPFLMNRWTLRNHHEEIERQGFFTVIIDPVMKKDGKSLHEAEFGAVVLARK
ncbi:MAG: hypothetical protein PHI03_04075, partial [Bacteroidales bacterium]|nr:hypothetical protein [Bacteroidales bacterium]